MERGGCGRPQADPERDSREGAGELNCERSSPRGGPGGAGGILRSVRRSCFYTSVCFLALDRPSLAGLRRGAQGSTGCRCRQAATPPSLPPSLRTHHLFHRADLTRSTFRPFIWHSPSGLQPWELPGPAGASMATPRTGTWPASRVKGAPPPPGPSSGARTGVTDTGQQTSHT